MKGGGDPQTDLYDAIRENNEQGVRQALHNGAKVNHIKKYSKSVWEDGKMEMKEGQMSPIIAVLDGKGGSSGKGIAEQILGHRVAKVPGINLNVKDHFHEPPKNALQIAEEKGPMYAEIIKKIKDRASADAGESALEKSIYEGGEVDQEFSKKEQESGGKVATKVQKIALQGGARKTRGGNTPKKPKSRKKPKSKGRKIIVSCSKFNVQNKSHQKMLEKEENKRKKRKEKKRLRNMTKAVVCQVKTMFPKKTPSPYNFEKEMKRWLEKEEKKRRARRTRKKRGGGWVTIDDLGRDFNGDDFEVGQIIDMKMTATSDPLINLIILQGFPDEKITFTFSSAAHLFFRPTYRVDYRDIYSVRYHEKPKRPKSAMKTGKRSAAREPTDDGGGGNTYDTMGLGRLFSQAGGKRRKSRKKRGGEIQKLTATDMLMNSSTILGHKINEIIDDVNELTNLPPSKPPKSAMKTSGGRKKKSRKKRGGKNIQLLGPSSEVYQHAENLGLDRMQVAALGAAITHRTKINEIIKAINNFKSANIQKHGKSHFNRITRKWETDNTPPE